MPSAAILPSTAALPRAALLCALACAGLSSALERLQLLLELGDLSLTLAANPPQSRQPPLAPLSLARPHAHTPRPHHSDADQDLRRDHGHGNGHGHANREAASPS